MNIDSDHRYFKVHSEWIRQEKVQLSDSILTLRSHANACGLVKHPILLINHPRSIFSQLNRSACKIPMVWKLILIHGHPITVSVPDQLRLIKVDVFSHTSSIYKFFTVFMRPMIHVLVRTNVLQFVAKSH